MISFSEESISLIKKLFLVFVLAFVLNLIWENWHAQFYVHYREGEITQLVLARAAIIDAIFITFVSFFFLTLSFLKKRQWLIIFIGVITAILLEIFALNSNRWSYNELMPVIPVIKTGLTPTIQLGLLSYFILRCVNVFCRKSL